MTKEHKDNIAVISAVGMLIFGVSLTSIGFAIEPAGQIHDSVLWVLGQTLIYCGAIFGVAVYTKGQIEKQVGELEDRMRRKRETEEEEEEGEE